MVEAVRDIDVEQGPTEVGATVQELKLLSLILGGEIYAFNIMGIKEIIEYGNVTRVPMVPPYIRGVINLRGSVVPVIDLAARLEKSSAEVTKRTCILIFEISAEDEKLDIGVAVDSVNNVMSTMIDEVEPAPSFGAGVRSLFIDGMVKIGGRFVIVLNLERVLSIEELSRLERAMAMNEERSENSD